MDGSEKILLIISMAIVMEIGTFLLLKGRAKFQNNKIANVILFGALVNFYYLHNFQKAFFMLK